MSPQTQKNETQSQPENGQPITRKMIRQLAEAAELARRSSPIERAPFEDVKIPSLVPDGAPQEQYVIPESSVVTEPSNLDIEIPVLAEDIDYPEGQLPEVPDLSTADYKGEVPIIEPDVAEDVQYTDNHPVAEFSGEVPTLEPFDPKTGVTGAMRAKMQYLVQPPNDVM